MSFKDGRLLDERLPIVDISIADCFSCSYIPGNCYIKRAERLLRLITLLFIHTRIPPPPKNVSFIQPTLHFNESFKKLLLCVRAHFLCTVLIGAALNFPKNFRELRKRKHLRWWVPSNNNNFLRRRQQQSVDLISIP